MKHCPYNNICICNENFPPLNYQDCNVYRYFWQKTLEERKVRERIVNQLNLGSLVGSNEHMPRCQDRI